MKATASTVIAFLSLAFLTLAGCHELGHIDGIGDYGGMGGNDVVARVEHVDPHRANEIRTDTGRTRFSAMTTELLVIYQQRNYAVPTGTGRLRRSAGSTRPRRPKLHRYHHGQESVQDRGSRGAVSGVWTARGRVGYVDHGAELSSCATPQSRSSVGSVYAPASVIDRFNRYSATVIRRIEGRPSERIASNWKIS